VTLSGNSLRQTVHTHRASVHQAAKLVAALLRVAWVTAGLAESNGSNVMARWCTSPTMEKSKILVFGFFLIFAFFLKKLTVSLSCFSS